MKEQLKSILIEEHEQNINFLPDSKIHKTKSFIIFAVLRRSERAS